jgi:threonine dehydratase
MPSSENKVKIRNAEIQSVSAFKFLGATVNTINAIEKKEKKRKKEQLLERKTTV